MDEDEIDGIGLNLQERSRREKGKKRWHAEEQKEEILAARGGKGAWKGGNEDRGAGG